jgi:hypothetical protein
MTVHSLPVSSVRAIRSMILLEITLSAPLSHSDQCPSMRIAIPTTTMAIQKSATAENEFRGSFIVDSVG